MKAQPITIEAVIRIVELLKKANNASFAFVYEIAREMGVRKTDLTEFVLQRPSLFITGNHTKGMYVKHAFASVEQNPWTEQWLKKTQEKNRKTLYLRQWDCYGQKEEYYVNQDEVFYNLSKDKSNIERPWLWRNTEEKMNAFLATGHFHEGIGSVDTWSGTKLPHCLNSNEMKALIDEGWTLTGEVPENIINYQNSKKAKP